MFEFLRLSPRAAKAQRQIVDDDRSKTFIVDLRRLSANFIGLRIETFNSAIS
jgi:hypothetical protein